MQYRSSDSAAYGETPGTNPGGTLGDSIDCAMSANGSGSVPPWLRLLTREPGPYADIYQRAPATSAERVRTGLLRSGREPEPFRLLVESLGHFYDENALESFPQGQLVTAAVHDSRKIADLRVRDDTQGAAIRPRFYIMRPMRLIMILAAALSLNAQSSPPQILPAIDLVYRSPRGTVFDANCSQMFKTSINADAVKAAIQRAPELQQLLNREIGAYLSATYAEVGMPYPYREVQATLTVCPAVTSMSAPLLLNVSRFLPTADPRVDDGYFVEIAYHELMHTYVQAASQVSSFRKKYANEDPILLNHLHVMALEKFVLLKLGRAEELKHVAAGYRASKTPAYNRAWEIVDHAEDYQALVKELKDYAAQRK